MREIVFAILLVFAVCLSAEGVGAAVYFVSPTGDDGLDGLSEANAWATIDNGDATAAVAPGDTVKILGGTYNITATISLTVSGTQALPIVYTAEGGTVFIAGDVKLFQIDANNIVINSLELGLTNDLGIEIKRDTCTVSNCYLHDIAKEGITLAGDACTLIRNTVVNTVSDGIVNDGDNTLCYGNTVVNASARGIHFKGGVHSGRIFNNIVVGANEAIRGTVDVSCGFNLIWSSVSDYTNGIVDSAGGIIDDPLFVDTANGNFSLQTGSPAIDAGLDQGYPYTGTAPDMGAVESQSSLPELAAIGAKSVSEGANLSFTVSATDAESTPILTTSTLPAGASFADNGDGTGDFDWTPSFVQSGAYDITFYATNAWSAVDSEIVTITVTEAGNQEPVLNPIGNFVRNENEPLAFTVTASDAESIPVLTVDTLPEGATYVDNGDGTADFAWTPDFTQSGPHPMTFYATDDSAAVDFEIINITVTEAGNQPPELALIGPQSVAQNENLSFTVTATDPDGPVNLSAEPLPGGATFVDNGQGSGSFDWTPVAPQLGDYTVVFYAEDTKLGIDSEVVIITVDTALEVVPTRIVISPDSIVVSADSTQLFDITAYDAGDQPCEPGTITWSLTCDIGIIDGSGLFDAVKTGQARVVAQSSYGPVDTSTWLEVIPGIPIEIVIAPDTATLILGDSVTFTVSGYDSDSNVTNIPDVGFEVAGPIGAIDSSGLFVAGSRGVGHVAATSETAGLSIATGSIVVETLIDPIPLGDHVVRPGQSATVLAFRIENRRSEDKALLGFTLQDGSHGPGNETQRLTNIDSIYVYLDRDDDSTLTIADSLLAAAEYDAAAVTLNFDTLTVPAYAGHTFLVSALASDYPRDGDSLDIYLLPATDIETADGSTFVGPEKVNSLGYTLIDGMTAAQITVIGEDLGTIAPADFVYHLLTINLPRNGYSPDTLTAFSVYNDGTAVADDIDSLFLYVDDGNAIWDGAATEQILGRLTFTGDRWTLSGLNRPLPATSNRFYLGAWLAEYPSNGTTLAFGVPKEGIEVASGNDGPLDEAVFGGASVTISTSEALTVSALPISERVLVSGESTGPILGLRLSNAYANTVNLESLQIDFLGADPGGATQYQLDSQIDSVQLYLNRIGNIGEINSDDSLISTTTVSSGQAVFSVGGLPIDGVGGTSEFAVVAHLNLSNARDGNSISFAVVDSTRLVTTPEVKILCAFPLQNPDVFTIEAFPAAAMSVNTVPGGNLFGGQSDELLLDLSLPRDGYANDKLASMRLINVGTVDEAQAIANIRLWADATGDGFTADDAFVGEFDPVGAYWQLRVSGYPLNDALTRFFVTASFKDSQFDGGTLVLQIPAHGLDYVSGLDGPDDAAVGNPETHLVFAANRITAISIPSPSRTIRPGADGEPILTFALYNGYLGQARTLQGVTLSNISRTISTPEWADRQLGSAYLYFDADRNRTLDDDSLIAAGIFTDGRLQLNALNVGLAPESLSYFFVLVDAPPQMIDGDSLAVSIAGAFDLAFAEQTLVNGDLPLTGGGLLIVDGSVSEQYETVDILQRTLKPGDTSITLFGFRPAANGDQVDVLQAVSLANSGDATDADIVNLRLWHDADEDGGLSAGDTDLGGFTFAAGMWSVGGLNMTVDSLPPALLVVGDIDLAATPSAVFRAEIPLYGCQYTSGNDGPVDQALTDDEGFTISNSGLRVVFTPLSTSYSVGQDVDLVMTVTNLQGTETATVVGEVQILAEPDIVTLDSGDVNPVNILPGESVDFHYYYSTDRPGTVAWRFRATDTITADTSAAIETPDILIQAPPSALSIRLNSSIPTAVTRGQANVFPLSVSSSQTDTSSVTAAARLDSLRITVRDASGLALAAGDVFSAMTLGIGYRNLTVLEEVPVTADVWLVFDAPVFLPPGETINLSLLVNIDSLTTASGFALEISDASGLPYVDHNTGLSVAIDASVVFPLQTASCRIDDPSQQMTVSYKPLLGATVNYGQEGVSALQLNVRHPGPAASSQIQLTEVTLQACDALGNAVALGDVCRDIFLVRQQMVIGYSHVGGLDSSMVSVPFTSPLTLNPGECDSIRVVVSAAENSVRDGLALEIPDSTAFTVRDLSSGSLLETVSDTLELATSVSGFPMESGFAEFRIPAIACGICPSSILPSSSVGGTDALPLIDLEIVYDGGDDYSPVRLRELRLMLVDSLWRPLDPDLLFDELGFRIGSGPITYQATDLYFGGTATFILGDTGLLIGPGDGLSLQLVADLEADAPYEYFVAAIANSDAFKLYDVSDTTWHPGLVVNPACSDSLPFMSSACEIYLPAGRPSLSLTHLPVQVGFPGQENLTILDGTLIYDGDLVQGDLSLQSLWGRLFRRTSSGLTPLVGAGALQSLSLIIEGETVAVDSTLEGDSLHLDLMSGYIIEHGSAIDMRLTAAIRPNAEPGNYVVRFDDSTCLQITDRDLATAVHPFLGGQSYPFLSAEVSVSAAGLEASYANYPNPFNPDIDGYTTITYVLTEDARVDLEVFTITGAAVSDIALDAFRAAGAHSSDLWYGVNDNGRLVLPGTYFCRITARYVSGRTETFKRKIAVVR